MFKCHILTLLITFFTMSAVADEQNQIHHQSFEKKYKSKLVKGTSNEKKVTNRKLNLVLPKDIMAKVRRDEKFQQRDKPNKVLPDLFDENQTQTSFGITGDFIKRADIKERGDIDGAEIQFHFKK